MDENSKTPASPTALGFEEQFRQLMSFCPDGVLVIDPADLRVLTANVTLCRQLGYPLSELIGLHFNDLHVTDEHARLGVEFRRLLENGTHAVASVRMRRRDGSVFIADVNANHIEVEGRPCAIGFLRDVTARDEAERRSRVKHDLMQSLAACDSLEEGARLSLEAAIEAAGMDSGGFYLVDAPSGDLVLLAHRGLSDEFLRGVERLPRGAPQWRIVESGQPLYSGGAELAAARLPHIEGEGLRALCAIPLVHQGRPLGCLNISSHSADTISQPARIAVETIAAGAAQAISRLHAQRELAEREELLSTIIAKAADSIAVIDNDTARFIEFNAAACEDLGYTREEFAQMSVRDIQAEHSPEEIRANIDRVRDQNETAFETRHRHKDGSLRNVLVRLQQLHLKGRDYQAAIWTDITEQRRAEERLRQAQKLEAVGQLAGGVAHDFNNVLAVILMHLGLVQEQVADGEVRESLGEVESAAQRAATLTRQLLMFSRRSVLTLAPLDLDEVVANLLKMLSRLIGEHITLRFDRRGRLPLIVADAGMMDQVLLNLVVNARDAMPSGGLIRIATDAVQVGEVRYVRLTVSDTGSGMDAATLGRIFEPFFTTKEAGQGTGLGLATVHGIVAQHKGWVEVESTVGEGSTFRVLLPAADETVVMLSPVKESRRAPGGQEVVLVAEDDENVRNIVFRTLSRLGYQVYAAPNGQEAVRLWQRHAAEVRLLLTDMVMPEGMTGLELAESLRAQSPSLKVIIASGYSAEMVEAGVAGHITYLPKPFSPRVLGEVVRRCLDS